MKRFRPRCGHAADAALSTTRPDAASTRATSLARATIIVLFSMMAIRFGTDFLDDRPRHRAASCWSAKRWSSC